MRFSVRAFARGVLLLLFSGVLVGCDHATKALAQRELQEGRTIELVSGVLDLRYTENHDIAFSLLRDIAVPHKAMVLGVVSAIIFLGTMVTWWQRRKAPAPEPMGYALIAAGAIGNIADRFARGFVIDFIHLKHWPVFNVADILIVAGLLLIAIGALRSSGSHSPSV